MELLSVMSTSPHDGRNTPAISSRVLSLPTIEGEHSSKPVPWLSSGKP